MNCWVSNTFVAHNFVRANLEQEVHVKNHKFISRCWTIYKTTFCSDSTHFRILRSELCFCMLFSDLWELCEEFGSLTNDLGPSLICEYWSCPALKRSFTRFECFLLESSGCNFCRALPAGKMLSLRSQVLEGSALSALLTTWASFKISRIDLVFIARFSGSSEGAIGLVWFQEVGTVYKTCQMMVWRKVIWWC